MGRVKRKLDDLTMKISDDGNVDMCIDGLKGD